jgi:ankyrin repeat protein
VCGRRGRGPAFGNTALLVAADGGHLAVVRLLVDHSAALSTRNENRRTALDLARTGSHADVVEFLESHATGRGGVLELF